MNALLAYCLSFFQHMRSYAVGFTVLFYCVTHAVDHYTFDAASVVHFSTMTEGVLVTSEQAMQLLSYPIDAEFSMIADVSGNNVLLTLAEGAYIKPSRNGGVVILEVHHPSDPNSTPRMHILLDAGHGGHDPGAMSKQGYFEKNITLRLTKMLASKLREQPGIQVDLTRHDDTTIDKYERLERLINMNPDLFISIHADAFVTPNPSGFGIFILDQDSMPSRRASHILTKKQVDQYPPVSSSGKRAAYILDHLSGKVKLHTEVPKKASLVILRAPHIPSMLIELGFLSNPGEAEKLNSDIYLQNMGQLLSDAIMDYENRV